MVEAGEGPDARHEAALQHYPGCPEGLLFAADREANRIIESAFLLPLAARFAAEVQAREHESAREEPPAGHLDLDIPF